MSGSETPPDTEAAPEAAPEGASAAAAVTPEDSDSVDLQVDSPVDSQAAYQVLARKYRPATFSELIGQDVLVRTLTNAFKLNRLAHAFILTGVRGIGKTTTARIIARALNCIGPDGEGQPTTEPCGVCDNCRAISEDRHVDVLEMDAASRTGVDDIRELIDGVRYRPTSARFKVYIIDEVHMLSRNAFNALLKTLEEPPEHVKFVFATTEIRKVPVTVLSRCQRFDLARVDTETLSAHFSRIATQEGASIADTALHLIVRAADGSVRDGLSLLDQAISQTDSEIDEAQVRGMLGLADRSQTFALLEAVLAGNVADALSLFDQQYRDGADPAAVLEDMLEIVHWLTRIKVVPAAADDPQIPEIERVRGKDMEARLKMPVLARAWQMLLKGLQEVRFAPSARQAAEMLLVRLAYTSTLPTPEEAVKSLGGANAPPSAQPSAPSTGESPPSAAPTPAPTQTARTGTEDAAPPPLMPIPEPVPEPMPTPPQEDPEEDEPAPGAAYGSFADIIALAGAHREMVLKANLENYARLVSFEPGRIELRPIEDAPPDLVGNLSAFLNAQTNIRWVISVSQEPGQPTPREVREAAQQDLENEAAGHPLVKAVMETFPDAKLANVIPAEDDGEAN